MTVTRGELQAVVTRVDELAVDIKNNAIPAIGVVKKLCDIHIMLTKLEQSVDAEQR